jgi:PadR family transcriptional regulator, regulatory protein PadR
MAKNTDSFLLPSSKEAVILELLKGSSGSLFGLELVQRSSGQLKRGTVYVTLQRMEEKGLIASKQEPRPNPQIGIPRRNYSITGLGQRALYAYWAARRAFTPNLAVG